MARVVHLHDPLALRRPEITRDPACPRCAARLLTPGHARLERVHVAVRCSVPAFEVRCGGCAGRWVLSKHGEGYELLRDAVGTDWADEP